MRNLLSGVTKSSNTGGLKDRFVCSCNVSLLPMPFPLSNDTHINMAYIILFKLTSCK